MDMQIQTARPKFVALLRANHLTLGNWNKFVRLFKQKEATEKEFYEKVLFRITCIRQKYRDKDIVISEIEDLFSPAEMARIESPGYQKPAGKNKKSSSNQ